MDNTFLYILFDILLYWFIVTKSRNSILHSKKFIKNQYYTLLAVLLIFSLFPFFSGDYYHYKEGFEDIMGGYSTGLEPIYTDIANIVGGSYLLFRLVIWGGSLLCISKTLSLVSIRKEYTLVVFAALFICMFSYARVSLSMALLFLGYALISNTTNVLSLKNVVAVALIASSFFFHKSAAFGIAMVVISYFLYDMSRKKMVMLCLIAPFAVTIISYSLNTFLSYSISYDSNLFSERTIDTYLSSDASFSSAGIAQKIGDILYRCHIYMILVLYIVLVWKNEFNVFPKGVKMLSTSFFIITVIASCFLFDYGGISTYTLYYRLLNFAMIPASVLVGHCLSEKIHDRLVHYILVVGITAAFYTMLYSLYCSYLGA